MCVPRDQQPDFVESVYLAENPDVKGAVRAGVFTSGLHHFVTHGWSEGRPGVAFDPLDGKHAHLYPPAALRARVHGAPDLASYLVNGQTIARDLSQLLRSRLVRVVNDAKVLDFGCGPGRVVTWLQPEHPGWEFHGADIDPEAIGWASRNLGALGHFVCNAAAPPLPYPDDAFDFVYSISIFTHLPEQMQFDWLTELARVTRPGGYLALTTHGERLVPLGYLIPEAGFYYLVGEDTDGLPSFYQTAFHTHDYIRREWSRYLKVKTILSQALCRHQDIVICRR